MSWFRRVWSWPPLLTAVMLCWCGVGTARGEITQTGPLRVSLLLDNSGSMYSGYRPSSGVSRGELQVPFYREEPWFREWLADFIRSQELLNAQTVEMSAFTSGAEFHASDVQLVHSRVPLDRFDAARALGRITGFGVRTFLDESLGVGTRGFEGLAWLITDNIVETGTGAPDREVRRFFETLRDTPRYRSVHLFKLPVDRRVGGVQSALAIYGILVSDREIDPETAAFYDRRFRDVIRTAMRDDGQPLFPDREHLKLKDLDVAPFDLQFDPLIEVETLERDALGREGRRAEIPLDGRIQSNLTQHSVMAGRYELRAVTPFEPDSEARERFGVSAIPPEAFVPVTGELEAVIPPTQSAPVQAVIYSHRPIGFDTSGLVEWLRAAFSGMTVDYEGEVEMTFEDIEVRFERDRLAGVFGADVAPEVFDFEDVRTIQAVPERDRVSMRFTSGPSRGLILFLFLLALAITSAVAARYLLRRERYRVTVGDQPTVVALAPFGSHEVRHNLWRLGTLRRALSGDYRFEPARDERDVQVDEGGQQGLFQARVREVGTFSIWIERLGGGGDRTVATGSSRGKAIRSPGTPLGGGGAKDAPTSPGPAATETKARPRPPIRRPGR